MNSAISPREIQVLPQPEKTCCEKPAIFVDAHGIVICRNCGMVIEQELVMHERRAYSITEINERRHAKPMVKNVFTTFSLNPLSRDARNTNGEQHAQLCRMLALQHYTSIRATRQDWSLMRKICSELQYPEWILNDSMRIYLKVRETKLAKGGIMSCFIAASIMAAARIHGVPCMFHDVSGLINMASKEGSLHGVYCAYYKIKGKVLPLLNMQIRPLNYALLLHRRAMQMKIQPDMVRAALKFIQEMDIALLNKVRSKTPDGVIAAIIYIVHGLSNKRMTQIEVATACNVTEVTVRNIAKVLLPCSWRDKRIVDY